MNNPLIDENDLMASALEAIKARINGEWDSPALKNFGPLSTDTLQDVLWIVNDTLANVE